jgi:membrane-bound ClpP family serine protease
MCKWLLTLAMAVALWHTASAATIEAHMDGNVMVVAINGTIAFHDDDQFSQLIGTRTGGLVILSSLGGA